MESEDKLFHAIYFAAKTQKKELLNIALHQAAIDINKMSQYQFSPITQLAFKGNKQAVSFLLAHGAQKEYAIIGVAMLGDRSWLNTWLAEDPSLIDFATRGAAIAQNKELTAYLVKRGGSPNAGLLGAALGNHSNWVDAMLSELSTPDRLSIAAFGAGINNNWHKMTLYQRKGASITVIARAIGISGHWHEGQKLLKNNQQAPKLSNELALGFSLGGHKIKAHRLNKSQESTQKIVFGIAARGDITAYQDLRKKHLNTVDWVLFGTACGGHFNWCNNMRRNQEALYDQRFPERDHDIEWIAKQAGFKQVLDQTSNKPMPLTKYKSPTFFTKEKQQSISLSDISITVSDDSFTLSTSDSFSIDDNASTTQYNNAPF